MIQRLPDWQSRLHALLASRQQQPFEWGVNDCCLFAADCMHAITGADPANDLRGYASEREALRIVRERGGLRAIAGEVLGAEMDPRLARVGDVGLLQQVAGRDMLAVCGGAHWVAPGAQGLEALPLATAITAWRVA